MGGGGEQGGLAVTRWAGRQVLEGRRAHGHRRSLSPKSQTFARPALSSSTFCGFRSRCTMPAQWAAGRVGGSSRWVGLVLWSARQPAVDLSVRADHPTAPGPATCTPAPTTHAHTPLTWVHMAHGLRHIQGQAQQAGVGQRAASARARLAVQEAVQAASLS